MVCCFGTTRAAEHLFTRSFLLTALQMAGLNLFTWRWKSALVDKQWRIWLDTVTCFQVLFNPSFGLLIQGSPHAERANHVCDLRDGVVCFHCQSSRRSPLVVSENSHLLQQCKEMTWGARVWSSTSSRGLPAAVKKSSYRRKKMRDRNVFRTKGGSPGRFTSHYNYFFTQWVKPLCTCVNSNKSMSGESPLVPRAASPTEAEEYCGN